MVEVSQKVVKNCNLKMINLSLKVFRFVTTGVQYSSPYSFGYVFYGGPAR
jgi:hypothetical protein